MTKSKQGRKSINVLIFKEDGFWVAQGLEYDLVAQGPSLDQVEKNFVQTLVSQILIDLKNGKEPLVDFGPAPEECIRHFNETRIYVKDSRKEIDISKYRLIKKNDVEDVEDVEDVNPSPFQYIDFPVINEARVFA